MAVHPCMEWIPIKKNSFKAAGPVDIKEIDGGQLPSNDLIPDAFSVVLQIH